MKHNGAKTPEYLLGKTGIGVTPIGLGTWQFAGGHRGISGWYWPDIPDQVAHQIVKKALESGISWFDTAECYGNGRSERLLKALQRLPFPGVPLPSAFQKPHLLLKLLEWFGVQ